MAHGLTHMDEQGAAKMVNVVEKEETRRRAVAVGRIFMERDLLELIKEERIEKGSVLGAARIGAIMAVKRTGDLIPLCHPLPIRGVDVDFTFHEDSIRVRVEVMVVAVTGVEMEALTGVSVALLTIYDMCKAKSHELEIGSIYLLEKEGGKGGHFIHPKREEEV